MTTKEKNLKLIASAIVMLFTMSKLPCNHNTIRSIFECFYIALSYFYSREGELFDMETTPISKDAFVMATISVREVLDLSEEDAAVAELLIKETD